MKLRTLYLILASLVISSTAASAISGYVGQIPNGSKFGCKTCHTTTPSLNAFGVQVDENINGGKINWASLYNLDADGDGFKNGVELQDPNGTWTSGAIGDPSKVTNPGDATSFPTSVFESNGSDVNKLIVDIAPSSGIAMLKFSISNPGNTYAVIYDLMGNLVLKSNYGNLAEGSYNMMLPLNKDNGASLGKGVYFVRIISNNSVRTAKIVL